MLLPVRRTTEGLDVGTCCWQVKGEFQAERYSFAVNLIMIFLRLTVRSTTVQNYSEYKSTVARLCVHPNSVFAGLLFRDASPFIYHIAGTSSCLPVQL